MPSLMLKSVYSEHDGKPLPVIIDLGYWSAPETQERYNQLRGFGLPRSRFCVEGFGRLLVEVPPRKLASVLAAFPILPGETYWRSTHHWRGLGKDDPDAAASAPGSGEV